MGILQRSVLKFSISANTQTILGEAKLKPLLLTQVALHDLCPSVSAEAHRYSAGSSGPFSVTAVFSSSCALSFVVVRPGFLSGAFMKRV